MHEVYLPYRWSDLYACFLTSTRTEDLFDNATSQPVGLALSEEVEHALQHGKPVVALETAILTHGMPPPTNVETCLLVEQRVRESGAIPATIGSR